MRSSRSARAPDRSGLPAIRFYCTIQRSPVRGSGSGEPVVGAGRPRRHIEVYSRPADGFEALAGSAWPNISYAYPTSPTRIRPSGTWPRRIPNRCWSAGRQTRHRGGARCAAHPPVADNRRGRRSPVFAGGTPQCRSTGWSVRTLVTARCEGSSEPARRAAAEGSSFVTGDSLRPAAARVRSAPARVRSAAELRPAGCRRCRPDQTHSPARRGR